ncbi:hypothetical protein KC959_04335, partial [Candidatus Saccharibacteria bacterium]|nr:hypothetical protein [Candidatus Saccharibacteria bacterium]
RLACLEATMAETRPGQNISLRFADAFDFEGHSQFNEIMMSNVLSSMIGSERARALVKLSSKLLTNCGVIVTRETFTPKFMPIEETVEHMRAAGFTSIDAVSHAKRPADYDDLKEYYGYTIFDEEHGLRAERYYCLASHD